MCPNRVRLQRVLRVDATHLGTRIDDSRLGTAPNYVWSSRYPISKDAHSSHLTSTRERLTLSWRQHQSGKLQSIEFKGLVRRPPHLVAKSRRRSPPSWYRRDDAAVTGTKLGGPCT